MVVKNLQQVNNRIIYCTCSSQARTYTVELYTDEDVVEDVKIFLKMQLMLKMKMKIIDGAVEDNIVI